MEYYLLENKTEIIADVVVFDNGKVIVNKPYEFSSPVVFDNFENFKKISVHGDIILVQQVKMCANCLEHFPKNWKGNYINRDWLCIGCYEHYHCED